MAFDSMVASAGRLSILTALAGEGVAEFVRVRERTCLTDGNLSAHAKRLEGAGLIAIEKRFREGRPVTSFRLTGEGRAALERHARELLAVIEKGETPAEAGATSETNAAEDDWVD
jgi:DNA-binding MarR family transcriptional regulator